ncbi:MAG: hypothetical protein IJU23_06880 [Proteobacteria bacterium]|nr:hypothetical protein [Pseudomonadota bacterium]
MANSGNKQKEKELRKASAPSESPRTVAPAKKTADTDATETAKKPVAAECKDVEDKSFVTRQVVNIGKDAIDAADADKKADAKADDKKADGKKADAKAADDKKAADKKDALDKADDEAADKDVDVDGAKKADKEPAIQEPVPVEPDSIFIDHGAILPEFVPGTCLYALVRDPGTLFVYWNATFESRNGWILTAYDAFGQELQSFRTPARRNGRGYFRIPTVRVARVTLAIVNDEGNSEVRLESKIRIAEQLGIVQPPPAFDERWVDVLNHEVVYEAPAPGRAPAFQEVYSGMADQAITGGGFDRAVENANDHRDAGNCRFAGSTSSRFGSLNAPGSSDTLIGSSNCLVRK